jgi:4-hydroxythreonine-4-phosphate dehydrogenase
MNTVNTSMKLPIAITLGDPAGVGPEIIAKAFRDAPDVTEGCFVVGDVGVVRRALQVVSGGGLPLPVAVLDDMGDIVLVPPNCVPVWPAATLTILPPYGRLSAEAGRLAAECVVWATKAALRGDIRAMVTAPLNKAALSLAGLPHDGFPGHTEMLQALSAEHAGRCVAQMPVRMMLANDELRVILVSIHLSLKAAIDAVNFENVLQTIRITHKALTPVLGRPPRIAVAGLNPHAGELGLFGREEIDTIGPAIAAASAEGIAVSGPFAPDSVFMRARNSANHIGEFDVVVAMYHDQGLIPVKYFGMEQGVNVTLGLPLVRTSPDHGTAFDIAGTGLADATSLIAAIRMAKQLS